MAFSSRPPRLPSKTRRPAAPKFQARPAVRSGVPGYGAFAYGWGGKGPTTKTTGGGTSASPAAGGGAPAPAAPSSAVLPPDPSYDATAGGLAKQRDTTLSQLSGQRTQGLLSYGYNENPSGALAFDPTNPYSQAAQMKKRYDESRTGTGNTMAARGQLYAGAYQQGQDIINRDQGKSEDTLMKSLIQFLAGNTGARSKAQTDYELGLAGAEADRIGRAASNPLYSPTGDTPAAAAVAAAKQPAYANRPQKTVRGKRYYQGQSGKWIPISGAGM